MIHSMIANVGTVEFPAPSEPTQVYMHPHVLGQPLELPVGARHFSNTVAAMLSRLGDVVGKVFITIDRRLVKASTSHRRPGPHVDGNFIYDWSGGGGGGWLTGTNGRVLPPEAHRLQYCNPLGGLLIASDYAACQVWTGQFEGQPEQGGDCSHMQDQLDRAPTFLLEPNTLWLGNSTCVHESLPVSEDVVRTLVRITLPADLRVH